MRKLTGAAVWILAASLAGCVKYHPQPLDPPHSEQLFRARTLNDPGLVAFLKRTDWPPARLGLNDLSAVALYFNSDLDLARAQLRTAQAAIMTAEGRPNPSLSVGGGYESSPESPLLFSFSPAFTLITAGKRGWRILEAEKAAEAARLGLEETAWRVRSHVRSAWLDHNMALRSLEILRGEVEVRAQTVAILEKRLTAGEASRPELEAVRAALIAVEVAEKAAGTRINESGAALAAAIGLPAAPPMDTETLPATPGSLPIDTVQQAGLLHRADIRRSLLEYAAAEANLHLEIANQYPDFQYSPGYNFDEGHHKITLTSTFNVPLFNRNRGPIAEAQARRSEAEARFNALQAQAIGEMEVALARYNGAREELASAEQRFSGIQQTRAAAILRAVRAGEEDRLALAGVQVERSAAARARLDALGRAQSAFGALEDAVQHSLDQGPPLPDPASKP